MSYILTSGTILTENVKNRQQLNDHFLCRIFFFFLRSAACFACESLHIASMRCQPSVAAASNDIHHCTPLATF